MELHFTPEQEARLAQLATQAGTDAERLVKDIVLHLLEDAAHGPVETEPPRKSLREVFESVRGLADDVDFRRNQSPARPVDFS